MADFRDLNAHTLAELLDALRREAADPADLNALVLDLQVHQIELELQNRELRDAQRALEESRDRYADLYDFAPVAYATLNRQGQITQMNLTAAQLLGVERGRVTDFTLGARLAPGDLRVLLTSLARVLNRGEEESLEVTLGRPAEARRDLRLVIRRERPRLTGEVPTACRVVLLDITEIKRAQDTVLAQQRFLQSVVDGIPDPIRVTGTEHQVLLMNAAARRASDDRQGQRETTSGGPGDPDPAAAVLAEGAAVTMVEQTHDAGGETRWIERIGAPLHDPAGAVIGVIESSRDITAHLELALRLQEQEGQLQHISRHDTLTNLPNRALFADRLNQAMRQARRTRRHLALLFLDLDDFKSINDSLGHPAGDEVLKQAAHRLQGLVREGDTVARMGGDEFTVILGDLADADAAGQVAQKLVRAFQAPLTVAGRAHYLTASIGISLYPQDGADVDTLVRNADAAMYRAKEGGRNSFRFYTEEMTARVVAQISLDAALRQALANQEFDLRYQPQHDLATGRIVGLEALIRWHHPRLGVISPDRFIPLAESTGLIVPISAWVVRTAAAQMQAWRGQGLLAGAAVSVNLSNRDFQSPNLAKSIGDIVAATGLDPHALAVEITETWIMSNPESAAGTIRHLQTLGIEVAIDDFGTGYSSLASLKRLAVNELKIDQSFVAELPADADGCAITRAVIALGHALGLRVVAEGIETQAQADVLKREGCRIGQGYLFSRPLPAAAFTDYVRARTPLPRAHAP